jgi:hypothetical protein
MSINSTATIRWHAEQILDRGREDEVEWQSHTQIIPPLTSQHVYLGNFLVYNQTPFVRGILARTSLEFPSRPTHVSVFILSENGIMNRLNLGWEFAGKKPRIIHINQ